MNWVYVIFLFVCLVFIIPTILFLIKGIRRDIRQALLLIPVLGVLFIIGLILDDSLKERELYKSFPEINNLTLNDSPENVRDSILILKTLLKKLPKSGYGVDYEIIKHRDNYNHLYLNQYRMGGLEYLEKDSSLKNLLIEESLLENWNRYVSNNNKPFDSLSYGESIRFINLIKYLDFNKINSGFYNFENDRIGLTYNDSLRIKRNTGFRNLLIDTTGLQNNKDYKIHDEKGGIFLIEYKFPN